ncbi:hypothetical protein HMPREF9123_1503 [Neisseria bacilliformis ATCC BAA-1200]|uniref:Uncharacterized protein n=1 Tax=Neisseria bacilliformis ATCC BAA-1200 TaxID=888742 RepID=F2BCL5_9NEIS|nr:hypothetical protein HMPREF9123_1503 [Neisseria bacilliformis ATCC BAA-1200]
MRRLGAAHPTLNMARGRLKTGKPVFRRPQYIKPLIPSRQG